MINKQILKFPAAMLLAGVALRVCMNGIISIWLRMGTPISSLGLFGIRLLLSVLLFLLVGRMVRRQYSKKEFIRSANLLVFYSIADTFVGTDYPVCRGIQYSFFMAYASNRDF